MLMVGFALKRKANVLVATDRPMQRKKIFFSLYQELIVFIFNNCFYIFGYIKVFTPKLLSFQLFKANESFRYLWRGFLV